MRKVKTNKGMTEDILLAEYEAVYRYALSICQNDTEAQDLTQETFLKAIQASDRFEGKSSLYTWLCTILKHLWINKCKKSNREVLEDEKMADISSPGKTIEQMITEKDFSKKIHFVLHTLDEPYKEVFSLRVFGELPFADIANLFSKTESWARVTYHRAKKMITEQLRKDGWL
ncbi:MAG: RNA polymerase sigma factor [Lachnospiraceae bacterium]|nr:RNA polymerase sigma factor [Lachnospiraceae bacterium]